MFALSPRPRTLLAAAALAGVGAAAFADPPPPRRPDPISIDMASPSSVFFGRSTSEIYGENPPAVVLGFGHDVFGPGPIPHVAPGAYGVMFFDEVDALTNGEIREDLRQLLYFSVSDPSIGMPFTPVRNQAVRVQAAGDRWVTNGVTSIPPAAGGGLPAAIVLPSVPGGPPHLLSANQTRFNLIPSIPPPAFNPGPFIPEDDMDGLELTLIDLTGDLVHDRRIYFSFNAATAAVYGISGADLQYAAPGLPWAGPFLGEYAPAFSMGLLAFADDIDALAVWDRGVIGRYDPGVDLAIFSLRPGSASLDGPDNIPGNADDYSPADVLITRFAGTHALYVPAAALGLLRSDDVDGLDVEPALGRAQFFDWWVQRVNIDVPWCPPPWNPPGIPPVNDFHVELIGIPPQLVRDPWLGSFPNATITPMPGGTRISWTGAIVPQGGVAHFGWEVMDDTQVQQVIMYWTRDGVRVDCTPIPDLVQRWRVDVEQTGGGIPPRVVDVLQNRSNNLVFVQRRAIAIETEMLMLELMASSPLVLSAPIIDPSPIALQPGETVELPFQYDINLRGYGVFYETQIQTPLGLERGPMFMTALTVAGSEDINQATGACCLGPGECLETTPSLCLNNGGVYHGDGTLCGEQTCGAVGCPGQNGDANCDGTVDFFDIDSFLIALFNPAGYQAMFCNGDLCAADADDSGVVDFFDIDAFLQCLFAGCP